MHSPLQGCGNVFQHTALLPLTSFPHPEGLPVSFHCSSDSAASIWREAVAESCCLANSLSTFNQRHNYLLPSRASSIFQGCTWLQNKVWLLQRALEVWVWPIVSWSLSGTERVTAQWEPHHSHTTVELSCCSHSISRRPLCRCCPIPACFPARDHCFLQCDSQHHFLPVRMLI